MEAIKSAVAKGKKAYADMEAKQEELNNHQDIKPIRLICGDVTPEALTSLLADNGGRMAMFSAEGGIFDILKGLKRSRPKANCVHRIWKLCKGKRFKKVADIMPSLELLTDYGYIKPVPGAGIYEGGRPKGDRYLLNPKHFLTVNIP